MKELVSVVVDDRVVLPAEVKQRLGIGNHDHIVFVLEDDGEVAIRPAVPMIEHVFGSVPALVGRESVVVDQLIEEAMTERAEEIVRRMGIG